jgi:hypothetical protein
MAEVHTIRNWAISQEPSNSMCLPDAAEKTARKLTIS